jgi:hypothetical protein
MIDPRVTRALAFVALFLFAGAALASDDALVHAKDLYRAAAYDEALVVLDQVAVDERSASRLEAREYRLFCLVALGRKDEASRAIQALLKDDPLYQPSAEQASPKVRAMFNEVRRMVLPSIVQRSYVDAKAAFDRKDPGSTAAFDRVLELLQDPDLASVSTFADLRIVTAGFRDLSQAFAASKPNPAATAAKAAPPASPAVTSSTQTAASPTVYGEAAAGIIPAIPQRQEMPPWVIGGMSGWQRQGVIELVIDETGRVISAVMSISIHPRYDPLLTKAALSWRYIPASRNGQPVRVRKTVRVRFQPN